jgi:hypothetical protein
MLMNISKYYMKAKLLILLLIVSVGALGQTTTNNQSWYHFKYKLSADSLYANKAFYAPIRDTNWTPTQVGALVYKSSDNTYYGWNGTAWQNIALTSGGSGTVTSVTLTAPTGFTITGSPITTSGTLALSTTLNGLLYGNGSNTIAAATVNAPLTYSGGAIGIVEADGSTDGYLSATNYTNFLAAYNKRVTAINVTGTATKTITLTRGDGTQLTANFTDETGAGAGSGITELNGMTGVTQTFATGTAGNDFDISSSGDVHTFDLPTASATKRGALSSADWTTFNNKIGAGDTASMLANYLTEEADPNAILTAQAPLYKSGQVVHLDTIALRAYPQKMVDSTMGLVAGLYTTESTTAGAPLYMDGFEVNADTTVLSTRDNVINVVDSLGLLGGYSVPTLQQVLDAGSTLTSNETISIGTNSLVTNGSTGYTQTYLSNGSNLLSTISTSTGFSSSVSNATKMGRVSIIPNYQYIGTVDRTTSAYKSVYYADTDSLVLIQDQRYVKIRSLPESASSTDWMMVYDTVTNKVGYRAIPSGGGGSGTVNSGAANTLAYYPALGTTVDDLAAITANRALISDANGLPTHSAVTNTELGYLSGVTSAIQTQLDSKQPDIQFKDEGVNAGTSGGITNVDFTGAGVTASESAGTLTVNIAGGGGSGTVTDFVFTDGNGFNGTVTTSTSTPTLSLTTTLTSGRIPFITTGGALTESEYLTYNVGQGELTALQLNSTALAGSGIKPAYADASGRLVPSTWQTWVGGTNENYFNTINALAPKVIIGYTANQGSFSFQVDGNILSSGNITLAEQTAPSTPTAGFGVIYPKSDGKLYWKDDAGTEYDLTAGAGSSTRFGYTGEDATAGENRDFALGTNYFSFNGSGTASTNYVTMSNSLGMRFDVLTTQTAGGTSTVRFLQQIQNQTLSVNDGTNESELFHTELGLRMSDRIEMNEQATPANPAAGKAHIYPKSDGLWYGLDDAGVETKLSNVAGGGLSDGDYGDITVGGTGTTMTIDNLAVTDAKINDVAWSKVTGEPTTISGYGITDGVTLTGTETLTNKRITARSGSVASSATPTINTDNVNYFEITAQAEAITSMSTNLTGTPVTGDKLWIAITGTASRAITWGASFEASTVALPTTTSGTTRLDVGFIWNGATSKWRCVAVQ